MLKFFLLVFPLLFLISCGGGDTSDDNTTTLNTSERSQSSLMELTNIEKTIKVSHELGLSIYPIKGVVDVISEEHKITFNQELYALLNSKSQFAVISLGSNKIEQLERKEGLVFKSKKIALPHFNKGYRNILIDNNTTTEDKIKSELILLFNEGGVPVMSYNLSSMENNSTVEIKGESNSFVCTLNNSEHYEVTAQDGLLRLPTAKDGRYICLDQYNNQAFDYNVSTEKIEEVLGSLYTYDSTKTQGALVKIYDDIYSQVDIAGLERRFKASNLLAEGDSLKLEVFYKSENSTAEPVNTVPGKEYLLTEGSYLLSFLMTSPQNSNIHQRGNLSPLKVIPKVIQTKIIPN